MFQFNSLVDVPTHEIVSAFNDAFASYEIPNHMTDAKLVSMMRARSVRIDHSFGLFDQDRLIGFVLNGSRRADEALTAYNSGTGIRAEYQGKGYGAILLGETVKALDRLSYRRYLLEVLTNNEPAISLYERVGFTVQRKLSCYKASSASIEMDCEVSIDREVDECWATRLGHLANYRPSWQNTDEAVRAIASACRLIETQYDGTPDGFAILKMSSGNVMQLGWNQAERAKTLLGCAGRLTTADELKVINVPETDSETSAALLDLGFYRFMDQYEMELRLDDHAA